MPAPRTLRRHARASKTLIAGFALACALAGSPASAQQPFNTVMSKLAEGKQVVGGTVSSADVAGQVEMPAKQTGSPMSYVHQGKQ